MDFLEIANKRQSCRKFDSERVVEEEKLAAVMEAARLAPTACNGQPFHFTVCQGTAAKKAAKATQGMGMNGFASDAPVMIVISEMPYCRTAAVGSKLKGNDYRSIDIGITAAYLTAEATTQGLDTCILGWLDDEKLRKLCDLKGAVRLVIALGYAEEGYPLRPKKRKAAKELITWKEN